VSKWTDCHANQCRPYAGASVNRSEPITYTERNQTERAFEQIIGKSQALESVLSQVECVAPTDSTVLIQGETGTGKELIAHAIHNASSRCGHALVKLNCAAIPLDLLESELFGHEKGAFTGAITQKIGRFELADKGTLFLDEVGDIPPALQPKLLRVLQEQEFERLGSGRTHKVNVRLVAATNRDLLEMVARNEFRRDLYYRLNVFPICLPSLRERREDIPALIEHFVETFSRRIGRHIHQIPPETMVAFSSYSWPGNIRELQNLVERAVILAQHGVLPNPLTAGEVPIAPSTSTWTVARDAEAAVPMTLRDSERALILQTLEATGWRVGGPRGAAAQLGLNRTTLICRMKKLGIERPN
jgi:transcriptional regulator with GAF, ATPase, and Fis domain